MSERIYRTEKVDVPDHLKYLGYKGKAYVEVVELDDENLQVLAESGFEEWVDSKNLIPTSPELTNVKDRKEAMRIADEMIANIDRWNCYN